jgi:hypothetical protein
LSGHQLGEIDLVGAADDGFGIVDDDETLGGGAASESIGMMIDLSRFADKERVEFGDTGIVVGTDDFWAKTNIFSGLHELLDGFFIGGGSRIRLIGKNG